jgi:hypothetical protein
MRRLLTFLAILFGATAFGQTSNKVDSLEFCHVRFKVPPGCTAASRYQVICGDYSMDWLYMTPQMLQTMPDQFVNQLSKQLKDVKREPIRCYIFNNEVKGYKISFQGSQGTLYQLIAYGIVNDQPVLAQLSLNREPKTNEDIPPFPGQIIRLSK